MNIDDIVKKLKKFPDIMELNHPITDVEIKRFQNIIKISCTSCTMFSRTFYIL